MNSGDYWTNTADLGAAAWAVTPVEPFRPLRSRRYRPPGRPGKKSGPRVNLEFLDHRIGQQLGGQLSDPGHRGLVGRPGDLQLESLALRVVDLRLKHHVNDDSGHVTQRTRPGRGAAFRRAHWRGTLGSAADGNREFCHDAG